MNPRRSRATRRGGALLLALIVVTSVAGISLCILRITQASTARQGHSADDKRAFYLAEAGLSEAYFGLGTGKSAQIGAADKPALVGDGLVWVDATERDDGLLVLRSTGLCNAGRATLEIVVAPVEEALGVFADEGIRVTAPILLDAYDAETGPYCDQVGPGVITVDTSYPFLTVNTKDKLLFYQENFYRYYKVSRNTYFFDAMLDYRAHPLCEINWDDFIDDDGWVTANKNDGWTTKNVQADFVDVEYANVVAYFQGIPGAVPATPPSASSGILGATTGMEGTLGSNGSISLSGGGQNFTLYGDVVPGVDGTYSGAFGVAVTGDTDPRTEPVELASVQVPDVELLPGFLHTSAIPKVIPSGQIGYESISVGAGSELVFQGPSSVVMGDLALTAGGMMSVHNEAGAVNLYVTKSAQLAPGSRVFVESQKPSELSLQGGPAASKLTLGATSQFQGQVYAPDSNVVVGSKFEVYGVLVANTLTLDPLTRLHCDTSTDEESSSIPLPRMVGWKIEEVPANVRQNRADPFVLLQLDKQDLLAMSEAHENSSWTLTVAYSDKSGAEHDYKGPFEAFAYKGTKLRSVAQLTPPDAEYTQVHGEWTLDIKFMDSPDKLLAFTGTIKSFSQSGLSSVDQILKATFFAPK